MIGDRDWRCADLRTGLDYYATGVWYTKSVFADVVTGVEGLDDVGLLARMRNVEGRRRELEAEQAVVLAELDRRRLFQADGHASMWGLLRASLGWSNAECRSRMRVARLVAEFVSVGEALFETWIPVAHTAEIARGFANPRCGQQIDSVIGVLSLEASRLEFDDFRRLVERWELLADTDGAHRDRESTHQNRNAHCGIWNGAGSLAAEWGDIDGVQNLEVFERFVEAEFQADWESTKNTYGEQACKALMPRTDAQRRADAVTAIFATAASTPPGSRRPEPILNVVISERDFRDMLTELRLLPEHVVDPWEDTTPLITDRRCETTSGIPVDPKIAIQIALHGHIRRVIVNSQGSVIDWGRQQRLFKGPARDAVMALVPRCTHPGCRVRAGRCQADHLIEWSNGGQTRPDNGAPRCPRHNRLKHHGYQVHRDNQGHWHTYRSDGTEIR